MQATMTTVLFEMQFSALICVSLLSHPQTSPSYLSFLFLPSAFPLVMG